jgi:hypothetical protein
MSRSLTAGEPYAYTATYRQRLLEVTPTLPELIERLCFRREGDANMNADEIEVIAHTVEHSTLVPSEIYLVMAQDGWFFRSILGLPDHYAPGKPT